MQICHRSFQPCFFSASFAVDWPKRGLNGFGLLLASQRAKNEDLEKVRILERKCRH